MSVLRQDALNSFFSLLTIRQVTFRVIIVDRPKEGTTFFPSLSLSLSFFPYIYLATLAKYRRFKPPPPPVVLAN